MKMNLFLKSLHWKMLLALTCEVWASSELKKLRQTLDFLLRKKWVSLAGYALQQRSTLLNYAGVRSDLLPVVADRANSKQGKYLPGSHIPIISPEQLNELNPETVIVLPWNLAKEIKHSMPNFHLLSFVPSLSVIQAGSR